MVGESLHSAFFLAFPCVDWSRAVLSCELKRRLERVELLAVSLSKQMLGEMSINEFQVNIGKNLSRMLYKYYTFMLFYFTISFFDFLELIFLLCQWIVTITLSSSFRGILDWGLRELPFYNFFICIIKTFYRSSWRLESQENAGLLQVPECLLCTSNSLFKLISIH